MAAGLYDHIVRPRLIVDRRALSTTLAAAVDDAESVDSARGPVLTAFKDALARGRQEIRRRFEGEGADATPAARRVGATDGANDGPAVLAATSYLMDQLVRTLFDFANEHVYPAANPSMAEQIAMVATGGYGRAELAPQSDIDLLFLLPYKQTPRGEQIVEYMLYFLWDLGLKVGHATRSVEECLRQADKDQTIRTALLEMRYLWGERDLYDRLKREFTQKFLTTDGRDFLEAKLAERDARHQRMGDSRYVVEPNVKDGKGGLRDLHTLFWIAKYLYRVDSVAGLVEKEVLTRGEARQFQRAERLFVTVRCHIHFLTGRPDDRLSFDLQREIATRLGYQDRPGSRGVERFMKHYYLHAKTVGDLTRIFVAALEAGRRRKPRLRLLWESLRPRQLEGFKLDGERLAVGGADDFIRDPVRFLSLFRVAQENDVDIHPATLRLVTQNIKLVDARLRENPDANRLFLELLTSRKDPETSLRRLNEAGVFGRFVPDFGRVVAQTQHDMYHTYTVDEHTIRAIGILSRIEAGALKEDHPVASDVVHKVLSREVLYLAVLLHDIAKGRNGDHSVLGAEIANQLCPRLGLDAASTETVAWLVRHHLAMSATAFQRDLQDGKTISDFAKLVQSPERLRLLLVLTVCDIRAVGPSVWNGWKAALLRQLYFATEEVLSGGTLQGGRAERVKAVQVEMARRLAGWTQADMDAHLALGNPAYWLSFDPGTLARHAELVRKAGGDSPLRIEHRVDPERAATELIVYTLDTHGLFARLAGAMAVSGATIVDAKIFTLSNGMALDTFWIQDLDGKPFDRADRLARLRGRIELALTNRLDVAGELAKARPNYPTRDRVFTVEPRVLVDNNASRAHTVIEVNGRDRPGFLHVVTRALAGQHLQIASAHVTTYGERAVDVFYVKDLFGLKVVNPQKLTDIETGVTAAIRAFERGDPASPSSAARAA
ncbi:MAG: [protein-PII] uridylyltransferase [Rhodospirillales bacterium]|nr:MAG: [protein-PII] uridylyltransferase [Rhodospirillales bacterium]